MDDHAMNTELARRRPANVSRGRVLQGHLVATARPVPARPSLLRRVMSPADWPWSVVLLVHLAAAGLVVSPLALLAMWINR
jgi:hypothetical protein